ncbi:VOC family protein [bacterium]|nr:VOC family protein [bacterium]
MLLGELSEIIVHVNDMQAMVSFYRDKLGLSIIWPADKDDYSQEFWVTFSTGVCTLALHGGGREPRVAGETRYGFSVADAAATRDWLLAQGVKCGEQRSPAPGVQVVDFWDIEGNMLFVEQRGQP